MSRSHCSPARFLLVALLVSASAFADTVTLTSGEKLEGKILKESADEVTISVRISAGVSDEQTIPKAKVAKIEKEQPDEIAWQPLMNLKPSANSLQLPQYDAVLRPLQAFVNEYPQSAHAAAANELLAAFAGEKARVEAGEVRLGERWLTKEEVDKERYQINARIALQYLLGQRQAGDLIGALNTFDLIEKTYPGAQNFPDAVTAARETLAALKGATERAMVAFKTNKAEFDAGVANAAPMQKAELLAARQRELSQGEAAIAAADKAKLKWPAFVPRSDKNLDAMAKKIPGEIQRLAALDVAKLREAAQLAEQGRSQLAAKNPAAVDTLSQAVSLAPQNELAQRLLPEAREQQTAAAAVARATPVPVATPARATPRPVEVAAVQPQAEPEKPFFLTPGGIITLIVLIGLVIAGVVVFKKIRGRANDVLE